MSRPRQHPGVFLAPNGRTRSTPLREVTTEPRCTPEQQQTLDRIRKDEQAREQEAARAALTIRDEPEAVGKRWLEDYAQVADLHRSQQHLADVAEARQRRPQLTVDQRIADLERRARRAHCLDSIERPVWIMRQDIQRARNGGRNIPQRTLNRLEALEALLDGVDDRSVSRAA